MKQLNDLDKKLSGGVLLFYGYSYKNIPDQIQDNIAHNINFYFKDKVQKNNMEDNAYTEEYFDYKEVGQKDSDIVFLDQNAVKGLLIGYPANAKYVLVNCKNFRYLPWIVIGLMRRVLLRKVSFYGFKKLTQNNRSSFWLVLVRRSLIDGNEFYLAENIGIQGFLKFLHKANFEYVVPRHFESLPLLHRVGGDLDIIVSDNDEYAIKKFLLENEGSIRVDVWSVSRRNHNKITYMPPDIAQSVINNYQEGRAHARIPNQLDALRCLIFHALYHKGFNSEIPSVYNSSSKSISNNDYLGAIKKQASHLDLEMDFTMEGLDDYMQGIGWRPSINMLSKIAKWNEWVSLHHS